MFDYIAVSGSLAGRMTEYAPHLHEHFVHPAVIAQGHYVMPTQPGYSIEMYPDTLIRYAYPHGPAWQKEHA